MCFLEEDSSNLVLNFCTRCSMILIIALVRPSTFSCSTETADGMASIGASPDKGTCSMLSSVCFTAVEERLDLA